MITETGIRDPSDSDKVMLSGSSHYSPLSPREQQVLLGVCKGLTNQEIANQLFLSVGTVKGYTHQIYKKIGVKNRVQAARIAQKVFEGTKGRRTGLTQ
ncbi:response regulator transcription factor [Bacillus sp. IITD106]|nr:response regulator transcription factor [Bacillus sp. IITD106]